MRVGVDSDVFSFFFVVFLTRRTDVSSVQGPHIPIQSEW